MQTGLVESSKEGYDSKRAILSMLMIIVSWKRKNIALNVFNNLQRDSSVGIATGYGLDDQGEREFESR
jgi:hypothetical protein